MLKEFYTAMFFKDEDDDFLTESKRCETYEDALHRGIIGLSKSSQATHFSVEKYYYLEEEEDEEGEE